MTNQQQTKDWSSVDNARFLPMTDMCSSPAAQSLTVSLAEELEPHEDRKNQRQSTLPAHHDAVAAIVGGLLTAAEIDTDRWSRRSMRSNDYTGECISYKQFMGAYKPMCEAGLIETHGGSYQRETIDWGNGLVTNDGHGRQTRLRATDQLLDLAEEFGINPENVRSHFRQEPPKRPLVLKAAKKSPSWVSGDKTAPSGQPIQFEDDLFSHSLEAEVKELNEFLHATQIKNAYHNGYRRIFNQGDQPGFAWNKGGRLYSLGEDAYQRLKQEDRLKMLLNGEPVVEIDITASYLSILYALAGQCLDLSTDPYEIDGIPRSMVKAWVTMTLGHTRFHTRWPKEIAEGFRKKGLEMGGQFTATKVGDQVIARHPILADWPERKLTCFDLMFIESEAVVKTMLELKRSYGIPCLPRRPSATSTSRSPEPSLPWS
jgi:hypothetical protein